jgi:hypothetical protein
MAFLQKVVDGFGYGVGLTVAWLVVHAALRLI